MNKTFTMCLNDRSNADLVQSRRYGIYLVFSKLFKAYFEIGQYALCKNVIRALEVSEVPELSEVPKSHSVSFYFCMGKYYFVEENFAKAEMYLSNAMALCHSSFLSQIRCILHYLISVNLLKGKYPKKELLVKYSLDGLYSKLIDAMKIGNISIFLQELSSKKRHFLFLNNYICLEQCIFVAYRNLFFNIFHLNNRLVKIPFTILLCGFLMSRNIEYSLSHKQYMEQVLVALISKNFIKGYIAHEKEFLVLSQNEPFPEKF